MKEIDINIEGYNVNGICVGCLNYDRKMFYNKHAMDCFKLIADIEVSDGLSIQICWECLALVKKVFQFKLQIEKSYQILQDFSRQHPFLNSPYDISKHAIERLKCNSLLYEFHYEDSKETFQEINTEVDTSAVKDEDCDDDVKVELENFNDPVPVIKEELPIELETDFPDVNDTDFPDTTYEQGFSDDEPIANLKRKKKRHRKEKVKSRNDLEEGSKNHRKLKNLPQNLVTLCTMNEVELWVIRSLDLLNEEFVKLKYKCEHCILKFNSKKLMVDHMTAKHKPKDDSESATQCDVCKAYLRNKDNLSLHRKLHLTAYLCQPCSFKTTLKKIMLKHVNDEHRDLVLPSHLEEYYKCSECGKEFDSKSKLTYHKGVCHQEKPQCDCCGKVFANKLTLKHHLRSTNRKDVSSDSLKSKLKEKTIINCKHCNKVFQSKKSYTAHVVIHEGVVYPCPVCGKLFSWRRNLNRHLRNHKEKEAGAIHECRLCGKRFSSRDCYNNHMRFSKKHADERHYQHECSHCGKKFPTKWCMIDHIDWDHLKKIKYQCSVCLKAFKTAKIKVAHMNNIHGTKKREMDGEHLCEICGKSYKTVKRLKSHVWAMHTHRATGKNFKCKLCPATFTWQTSIYKHMKMMHDTSRRTAKPAFSMNYLPYENTSILHDNSRPPTILPDLA